MIRPGVRCENLASQVLGQCACRVAADFERRYGLRPWLLESFVDGSHYDGAYYQAANWILVGRTKGRGRNGPWDAGKSRKDIYLYPLVANVGQRMGVEPLPVEALEAVSGLDAPGWAEQEFTPPPHPNDFSNRLGFVSRHCHCSMTDGVCFITIQGQRMGCYRLGDRAAQRSLLKQVYRACQTTQAQLWERIGPRYPNHAQEGRKLIAAALRAPGSMRLQPGQIWVELAPQPLPTALEWSPNFVKVST